MGTSSWLVGIGLFFGFLAMYVGFGVINIAINKASSKKIIDPSQPCQNRTRLFLLEKV